ncbi:MAG: hypothetical protein ACLQNE_04770 [Thermoguttaceae bacterium]
MIPDPTDEIRSIRDRLAAACNYDVDRIVEETQRHHAESGRASITLPPRSIGPGIATNQALNASGRQRGS